MANGTSILTFVWNADGLSLCGNNVEISGKDSGLINTISGNYNCVVADFLDEIMALVTKVKPEIIVISTVDESEVSKFHNTLLPNEMKRRLSKIYNFFDKNGTSLPSYHDKQEKIVTGLPNKSVIRTSIYIDADKIKLYSKIDGGRKDVYQCNSSNIISGAVLNKFVKNDNGSVVEFNIISIKLNDVKEILNISLEKDADKYLRKGETATIKNILNRVCLVKIFNNLIKTKENSKSVTFVLGDFNYMLPIKDFEGDNITIGDLYEKDQLKNNLNQILGTDLKYDEGVNFKSGSVSDGRGPEFLPGFKLVKERTDYLNPFIPFSKSKALYEKRDEIEEVGWRERIVYNGEDVKCLQYSSVDYGNTRYSRHAGVMGIYVVGDMGKKLRDYYGEIENESQLDYVSTELEGNKIKKGIYGNDSVNYTKFNKVSENFSSRNFEEFLAVLLHVADESEKISFIIMAIEFFLAKKDDARVDFFRKALSDFIYNTENKYYNNFDIGFFNIRIRAIKHKILGKDFDKDLEERFSYIVDNNYIENKDINELIPQLNFEMFEKMSDKAFKTLFDKLLKNEQYELCKDMIVTRENKFILTYDIGEGNFGKINDDIIAAMTDYESKEKNRVPSYIRYVSTKLERYEYNNISAKIKGYIEIKPYYLYKESEKFYLDRNIKFKFDDIMPFETYKMFFRMNESSIKSLKPKIELKYDISEDKTTLHKNLQNIEKVVDPEFNMDSAQFLIDMEKNRFSYLENPKDFDYFGILQGTNRYTVISDIGRLTSMNNFNINIGKLLQKSNMYSELIPLSNRMKYVKYKSKSPQKEDTGKYFEEILNKEQIDFFIWDKGEAYWHGLEFSVSQVNSYEKGATKSVNLERYNKKIDNLKLGETGNRLKSIGEKIYKFSPNEKKYKEDLGKLGKLSENYKKSFEIEKNEDTKKLDYAEKDKDLKDMNNNFKNINELINGLNENLDKDNYEKFNKYEFDENFGLIYNRISTNLEKVKKA